MPPCFPRAAVCGSAHNVGNVLRGLLAEMARREGSYVVTSATDPAVQVAVHEGRVWRADIEGEAPASLRVSPEVRARAAAARREERGIDTLDEPTVREIDAAHKAAIVDVLLRAEAMIGTRDPEWDFRPTSAPPRLRTLRGHPVAAIAAALQEREIHVESKLDRALEAQRGVVPECVAVGVVDLEEGALLAYKSTAPHRQEILDLLGAQTRELFKGAVVQQIEALFREGRGDTSTGPMFDLFTAETRRFLHVWRRSERFPSLVFVFVCRATASIGMVKAQSKLAATALDIARAAG